MTKVLYFPRYSQRENFITNNTLLLLHRLYDSNRRRFQRFLGQLLEEKADVPISEIGLQIRQQLGTSRSVLDGFLHQSAIRIGIETKRNGVNFDLQQLMDHLDAFEQGVSGYLILLRPTKIDLLATQWRQLRRRAERKNVILASITFEQVIASFRSCLMDHDEDMQDLIDDFEAFCSEQELLDSDQVTIFVPPCGQSFNINVQFRLYFCPSSWTRRRVRYLGIYKNKEVQYLGVIEKVVQSELRSSQRLICQDEAGNTVALGPEEKNRIRGAMTAASQQNSWDISHGHKFFLCNQLFPTEYKKDSSGGIMGHRYLNVGDQSARDLSPLELADRLRMVTWR